jgi:hypothetical protein
MFSTTIGVNLVSDLVLPWFSLSFIELDLDSGKFSPASSRQLDDREIRKSLDLEKIIRDPLQKGMRFGQICRMVL